MLAYGTFLTMVSVDFPSVTCLSFYITLHVFVCTKQRRRVMLLLYIVWLVTKVDLKHCFRLIHIVKIFIYDNN